MIYIPAIGIVCVGIIVGWLIRYFIRRFKEYTPPALSAIIGITFGGVIAEFIQNDQRLVGLYPVGLVLGFILYVLGARGPDDGVRYSQRPDLPSPEIDNEPQAKTEDEKPRIT